MERERRESEVESFPNQVFTAWRLAPVRGPPPPPALAGSSPLKAASAGTKRPLSVARPSCSFSQMSSCLHPTGPVPLGADRPSLWRCSCLSPWQPQGPAVLTAQEAGLMEAAAFALNLLGEVHGLLADPTFLASSPVWHSETGQKRVLWTGPWGHRLPGTEGHRRGLRRPSPGGHFPSPSSNGCLGLSPWDQQRVAEQLSPCQPAGRPAGHNKREILAPYGRLSSGKTNQLLRLHLLGRTSIGAKPADRLEFIKHK